MRIKNACNYFNLNIIMGAHIYFFRGGGQGELKNISCMIIFFFFFFFTHQIISIHLMYINTAIRRGALKLFREQKTRKTLLLKKFLKPIYVVLICLHNVCVISINKLKTYE